MLVAGAAISVGVTYFLGVRNFVAQTLIVGALTAITGLVLFLILARPAFHGQRGRRPAPMREVAEDFVHLGA